MDSSEQKDDTKYDFIMATENIFDWLKHNIRYVQQNKAKIDVLAKLNDTTCVWIRDWAQKVLPIKYRESQKEYFVSGRLSQCDQCIDPKDNAGCYAGNRYVETEYSKSNGLTLVLHNYNEPYQADRESAVAKRYIKAYVNSGHDLVTAEDVKKGILYQGGVKSSKVAIIEVNKDIASILIPKKITGISNYHSVQFAETEMIFWLYYDIGSGEKTGIKTTPEKALKEMRGKRNKDGTKAFLPTEYMTTQQIRSMLSRMASLTKKGKLVNIDEILEDDDTQQKNIEQEEDRNEVQV
ncbi:hypothetical protein JTE90_025452 [Oedothorax gibbosus]|uniref:Uncharacterized protein n=1 Tax=Oedothorax gibbosus TaxID=931172 RepID=A0AAV6U758_9ARAC|nr:hypothetical protein JTE90_025452 [Oedothorax gibbosus]